MYDTLPMQKLQRVAKLQTDVPHRFLRQCAFPVQNILQVPSVHVLLNDTSTPLPFRRIIYFRQKRMGQLHQLPVREPGVRNGFTDINSIFRINDNLRHSAIPFLQHGNPFEVVLYEPHCFLHCVRSLQNVV